MQNYLNLFIDKDYPCFIDKYLNTKTLDRLKNISQFCGCDYTKLYSPLFFYSRYNHSLVVAHMTWHFTHNKKDTIAALLHDVGTPCFAHCIDYVFGDYLEQESSEKDILELILQDDELLNCLKKDNISLEDLKDLTKYPILENKTPKLCTDRLDGVLHTCYVWLHTHSLNEIKEVYDNLTVLTNENKVLEIGFKNIEICEKFVNMVITYAEELQGNKDKYVMKYIAEIIKLAFAKNLITLTDLYNSKESDIISILETNFESWSIFQNATELIKTNEEPTNFYVSFKTKKRNVIPLIATNTSPQRINNISNNASKTYQDFENYKDTEYAYLKRIKNT